jgi:NYN domain
MLAQNEKIALFIDGANLYTTAKSLGLDIDYKRLLREFQSGGHLLRVFYYTAVFDDQESVSIRPLIDWLEYNGYTVVTKAAKEFVDHSGRRRRGLEGDGQIERIFVTPPREIFLRDACGVPWLEGDGQIERIFVTPPREIFLRDACGVPCTLG